MAASYTCDGCGCNVAKPLHVGSVIKRDYCEACEPKAQAFLTAEDEMRAALAEEFSVKRAGLIVIHGRDGFKLPDTPCP